MADEAKIDPGHEGVRNTFRIIGPVVGLVGLGFLAVGMVSFFSAFGSFEPPRYFWCAFVGIPLLGIGAGVTKIAYMGAVFRYFAGEVAPVQKDTFNYLARETSPGLRDIARSVGQGFREGAEASGAVGADARCPKCQAANPAAARYCGQCGSVLSTQDLSPE